MAWPTTDDPKTEFVTLRMTVRERADLDAAAVTAGMRPSAYVRDCVRRVMTADAARARKLKKGEG